MAAFKDVNRDAYLHALLRDVCKEAHLNDIPEKSKTILEFILKNPSNKDSKRKSLNIVNDYVVISKLKV